MIRENHYLPQFDSVQPFLRTDRGTTCHATGAIMRSRPSDDEINVAASTRLFTKKLLAF
eukprot:COSAG05_NODE_13845_length_416_cov_1.312303_1_plen_58_part_01